MALTPLDLYGQIRDFIMRDVKKMITKAIADNKRDSQYAYTLIGNHAHTGTDSAQIDPVNLLPFPVLTAVPTYKAPNGTWRFVYNAGNLYIYVVINNVWTNLSYHL